MARKLIIKLIAPRMSLRPMDSELKRRMSPSLSLVTVAGRTPKPHEVYIEDENLQQLDLSDSPDIVGIMVNVDTSERAVKISAEYRKRGICVVFGGIHASANPDSVEDHCDSVVVGEAEVVWPRLLNDFIEGNLQPRYQDTEATDMSLIPIPNWNLIKKEKYLYHNIVVTSRGCPFECDFCYNSNQYVKKTYRNRPVDLVVEEINALNNKQIMFIEEERIIDTDPTKYNTANVVFKPKNMTASELREGYFWIYREFYSFKNIRKRKPDNKALLAPFLLFNLGYRKFGRLTALLGKLGFMNRLSMLAKRLSYGVGA